MPVETDPGGDLGSTVTAEAVLEHVNAGEDQMLAVTECLTFAEAVLVEYLKGLMPGATVPLPILDEAVLLVAADEFQRRRAPNGVLNQQIATEVGTQAVPVRIGRDPLAAAYPLLAPYMDVVIA